MFLRGITTLLMFLKVITALLMLLRIITVSYYTVITAIHVAHFVSLMYGFSRIIKVANIIFLS